jgi:hypothetical protein
MLPRPWHALAQPGAGLRVEEEGFRHAPVQVEDADQRHRRGPAGGRKEQRPDALA